MTPGDLDPRTAAEVARQKAILLRGKVDLVSEEELDRKLARSIREGKPLRVKLGVDPTASMLHLGFTVVLNKLRAFQDLGHQAVLIIGDATALVGDPTGRNQTRPRLDPEEVARNADGYLAQACQVLDRQRLEIRRNAEWLGKLDFLGMIRLTSRYTVARLLERNDFAERYKNGVAIHLHELIYPLLQGWDSVMVRADVELGGTDQLFNLLVGRDLQREEGQDPQVCLTTPILIGLDGKQKMSKSYGNTVGISEPPGEMMTKVMRLDDAQMQDWFLLATRTPEPEIDRILAPGRNPRDAKLDLGRAIISQYHSESAAEAAADSWLRTVSQRALPETVAHFSLPVAPGQSVPLVDLLLAAPFGTGKSRSEVRRWITERSVRIDDVVYDDIHATVPWRVGMVIRHGKQHAAVTGQPPPSKETPE